MRLRRRRDDVSAWSVNNRVCNERRRTSERAKSPKRAQGQHKLQTFGATFSAQICPGASEIVSWREEYFSLSCARCPGLLSVAIFATPLAFLARASIARRTWRGEPRLTESLETFVRTIQARTQSCTAHEPSKRHAHGHINPRWSLRGDLHYSIFTQSLCVYNHH